MQEKPQQQQTTQIHLRYLQTKRLCEMWIYTYERRRKIAFFSPIISVVVDVLVYLLASHFIITALLKDTMRNAMHADDQLETLYKLQTNKH